jgi:hypothetical protein
MPQDTRARVAQRLREALSRYQRFEIHGYQLADAIRVAIADLEAGEAAVETREPQALDLGSLLRAADMCEANGWIGSAAAIRAFAFEHGVRPSDSTSTRASLHE